MKWLGSVRLRLSLAAAVLVGVAGAAGSWWFASSIEHRLLGQIRAEATAAAGETAAAVRVGDPAKAADQPNALVQVFDADAKPGTPLLGLPARQVGPGSQPATSRTGLPAPDLATAPTNAAPFETTVDGIQYTVSTVKVGGPTGSYIVLAALPLAELERTVAALKDKLTIGLPVLILMSAVMAWLVAARALRPIERMRQEAAAITATTTDRRLPRPRARDEVGRLADTMNQMLDRLHDAADRQRRFVSDASHELRSPIATLRANLEIGLAHPATADWPAIANDALRDAQQLNTLVDELLELATLDEQRTSTRTDVDLADLLREEACRPRSVPIRVNAVGPATIIGDRKALVSMIRNLLDNAATHATTAVHTSVHSDGHDVVLIVEDDGPGVPTEERDRMFDRFARVDESRTRQKGGAGLGLAIIKRVVDAHEGTVNIGTSQQGGASLNVRLPAPPTSP